MKRAGVLAATAAIALLAGCGSSAEVSSTSSSSSTSQVTAVPDGSSAKPFGTTYVWDDKLAVTVTMPEEFTPTDTAAGVASFDKFVRMTIVVRNGTGQVYEGIELSVKATTGGKRGSRVIDDGMDLPKEKIQPGKSQTFGLGLGTPPGRSLC